MGCEEGVKRRDAAVEPLERRSCRRSEAAEPPTLRMDLDLLWTRLAAALCCH